MESTNDQRPLNPGDRDTRLPLPVLTPADPAELDRLIRDLAHDYVEGNAMRAASQLEQAGEVAVPALRAVLDSRDRQQRQLAGYLLCRLGAEPTRRLLEVLFEGLHHDRLPYDPELKRFTMGYHNAQSAMSYLGDHVWEARPLLLRGLFSPDEQQRYLCAFVLATGAVTDRIWRTVEILLPHLEDNEIRHDALMSAHALYKLGTPVLPYLRRATLKTSQGCRLLRLIELDIVSPPKNQQELRARRTMHGITGNYHDPVIEFEYKSFMFFFDRSTLPPR